MSGVLLVLRPYLLCGCVTFDVQAFPSVKRAYLVVLVLFNAAQVPLNRRLFDLGINSRKHVKLVWFHFIDKYVYLSIAVLMGSRPSQGALIPHYVILNLEQIF